MKRKLKYEKTTKVQMMMIGFLFNCCQRTSVWQVPAQNLINNTNIGIMEESKKENEQAFAIHNVISWVAVKDELPNDVTPVLVYGECCDVCWHIKIAELEQGDWWESGTGEDLVFAPTYWAKLPKPPCL